MSHRGPRRLSGGLTEAMEFFLRGNASSEGDAIQKGSASPRRSPMVRANSESDLKRISGSRERRTPEKGTRLLDRCAHLYEHQGHLWRGGFGWSGYGATGLLERGIWVVALWRHGFVRS